MLVDSLLLLLGLALLLGGGEALVRGASALARQLGVAPMTVGLTVVAFGTSAPELVVSVLSATSGDAGIAFGNVVGSNIANLGLILGATACFRALSVESKVVTRELPMMLLAGATLTVLALDGPLDGAATSALTRTDGLVLLLLFGVFLYYTAFDVRRARRRDDPLLEPPVEVPQVGEPPLRRGRMLLTMAVGLAGLAVGGDLLVDSASALAVAMGVPSVVVGSTIVAAGTSAPELATSILAARRGQTDLAVGNVVGSNLFNSLFVLGTTASIAPVATPAGGGVDLLVMLGVSVLTLPFALSGGGRLSRGEGALMLALYVGYVSWQTVR